MSDDKITNEQVSAEKPAAPVAEKPAAPIKVNPLEKIILEKFAGSVETGYNFGDLEIRIEHGRLSELCEFLIKDSNPVYDFLRNVTVVDYGDRFEMVYHLCAMSNYNNIIIKATLDHGFPLIDSVTPYWRGADWQEREIFDLMGIGFNRHPDLRRILLPDEWVGYPLRKDYKIVDQEVASWSTACKPKN